MSELTNLVVVELRVSRFDEWMMVLAIKNKSVWRTSDLVLLESLGFWLLGSRNDGVVSEEIARRRDLSHATSDIFNSCHWSCNHVADLKVNFIPDVRYCDGSYLKRVAMMATPWSPMTFLRAVGTSM